VTATLLAKRIGLAIGATVMAVIVVEAVMRLQVGRPTPITPSRYTTTGGAISYTPGATFQIPDERRQLIEVAIDARGFRNPTGEPMAPGTVLLLGDSFTVAVNTPEAQTIGASLRQLGFPVVNAGVEGTGTTTHADILERRFADLSQPTVVLLFFLGNDFKDNYWSSPLPTTWSAQDRRRLAAAALFERCAWAMLCRAARDRFLISAYQVDPMGSYPLAELLMIAGPSDHQAHAIVQTREPLERIAVLTRSRGGRLIVVGVPSKAQVLRSFPELPAYSFEPRAERLAQVLIEEGAFSWERPDQFAAALARDVGAEYLSLLAPLRERSAREPVYDSFDLHWNAAGQEVAARELLKVLGAPTPPPASSP
jgi:hypothetical protein